MHQDFSQQEKNAPRLVVIYFVNYLDWRFGGVCFYVLITFLLCTLWKPIYFGSNKLVKELGWIKFWIGKFPIIAQVLIPKCLCLALMPGSPRCWFLWLYLNFPCLFFIWYCMAWKYFYHLKMSPQDCLCTHFWPFIFLA